MPKKQSPKLRWHAGKLTKGPFAGPIWGARTGETFLMIVQRPATEKRPAYYELWTDGVIHDETQSATLAAAKAFGEATLAHTQKKAA